MAMEEGSFFREPGQGAVEFGPSISLRAIMAEANGMHDQDFCQSLCYQGLAQPSLACLPVIGCMAETWHGRVVVT